MVAYVNVARAKLKRKSTGTGAVGGGRCVVRKGCAPLQLDKAFRFDAGYVPGFECRKNVTPLVLPVPHPGRGRQP